jgi:hypothetical protein
MNLTPEEIEKIFKEIRELSDREQWNETHYAVALIKAGAQKYKDKLSKLTPDKLREKIIQIVDIARQEGMIHSKDGKHSESSNGDTDDILSLYPPQIEKARLEERENSLLHYKIMVANILTKLKNVSINITNVLDEMDNWQALKDGK